MTDNQLELVREIGRIYCHLSPENLTCDGELSRTEVDKRYRQLKRELRKCFDCLGREVSEEEVWNLLERG